MPALWKPLDSFQILRHEAYSLESMAVIADGDRAIRKCVCTILELAPYKRRRCYIPCGMGVARTALLMVYSLSSVHLRYDLRQKAVVRAIPR